VRIGNPYRDEIFRIVPGISRDRDLVFLGRLVSDKGVDLLLLALASLRDRGLIGQLTIIGSGPEEPLLRDLVGQLALGEQVQFAGPQGGEALVQLLNRHRIMVVPSRWEEPFGIVALEGIACGCVIVGSSGGGLPEAIGPCGVTFPNGDHAALAEGLRRLLDSEQEIGRLRNAARAHLRKFTARAVADAYLAVFHRLHR
jgi:glycosyltransferase involved in cell wall biosynthesis